MHVISGDIKIAYYIKMQMCISIPFYKKYVFSNNWMHKFFIYHILSIVSNSTHTCTETCMGVKIFIKKNLAHHKTLSNISSPYPGDSGGFALKPPKTPPPRDLCFISAYDSRSTLATFSTVFYFVGHNCRENVKLVVKSNSPWWKICKLACIFIVQ